MRNTVAFLTRLLATPAKETFPTRSVTIQPQNESIFHRHPLTYIPCTARFSQVFSVSSELFSSMTPDEKGTAVRSDVNEDKRDAGQIPTPRVKESTIRLMTRLALQYKAVNLSQGFPNEPPPRKLRLALAQAVLSGRVQSRNEEERLGECSEIDLTDQISKLLEGAHGADIYGSDAKSNLSDELNQYSPPMGRPDSRLAVSHYYDRIYSYSHSPDHITLTLGATEAVAVALRTIGKPGDKIVIIEPFHELYPSQCGIFYLDPIYVTLRPKYGEGVSGSWQYDKQEMKEALDGAKALVLNTPHNPTGKVFTHSELKFIVDLCVRNNVYIITDEIYEHMCYPETQGNNRKHILVPKAFPEATDLTLVCNSLGKSASATGWRLGWCLHPPHLTDLYRGVHDQMVAMAPHPMQFASLAYLNLPLDYFTETLPVKYRDRVFSLAQVLKDIGFEVALPEGSYYLFVYYQNVQQLKGKTPMEAAMYLMMEVGVACVPGDNFYGKSNDGGNYLRFAACRSVCDLEKAKERLKVLKPL